MTPNVRRILTYQRTFAHYLADEEALLNGAQTVPLPPPLPVKGEVTPVASGVAEGKGAGRSKRESTTAKGASTPARAPPSTANTSSTSRRRSGQQRQQQQESSTTIKAEASTTSSSMPPPPLPQTPTKPSSSQNQSDQTNTIPATTAPPSSHPPPDPSSPLLPPHLTAPPTPPHTQRSPTPPNFPPHAGPPLRATAFLHRRARQTTSTLPVPSIKTTSPAFLHDLRALGRDALQGLRGAHVQLARVLRFAQGECALYVASTLLVEGRAGVDGKAGGHTSLFIQESTRKPEETQRSKSKQTPFGDSKLASYLI